MISLLFRALLYASPRPSIDSEQLAAFAQLLETMKRTPGALVPYRLPYPKWHFLHCLALEGKWVFHGSNHPAIERFEPREQTLYDNNGRARAVFATTDPIWPLFYAVFRRDRLVGSFRNGCIVHGNRRYHYYSLNDSTTANRPWTDGMLYILPNETFRLSEGGSGIRFDEWISEVPVEPMWRVAVSPEDFFFAHKVGTHRDGELLARTWLLYKARTRRKRRDAT